METPKKRDNSRSHLRLPSDEFQGKDPFLRRLPPATELRIGFHRETSFKKDRLLHLGARGQVREQKIKEGGEEDGFVCVADEK